MASFDKWLADNSEKAVLRVIQDLLPAMGYHSVRVSKMPYVEFEFGSSVGVNDHAAILERYYGSLELGEDRYTRLLNLSKSARQLLDGERRDRRILAFAPMMDRFGKRAERPFLQENIHVIHMHEFQRLVATHLPDVSKLWTPEPATKPLVQLISNITPQLLTSLRQDPQEFRNLTPEQFELFAANRLDAMGYAVTLTGPTNRKDGGVDIIAVPKNAGAGTFLLAGQVKHHEDEQKTGREAVDRLLSLKTGHFRLGMLITNTEFTKDAKWAAAMGDNQFFARLRDFRDIKRWLEDDFTAEEEFRELPDEIELAPGVKIKVPRPGLRFDSHN